MRNCWPHRRTPQASTNPAIGSGKNRTDIGRPVNNDRSLERFVIEPRLQAFHAQGIPVLADVARLGPIQTQAGGKAFILVGELDRHVLAAVATVGDQFPWEQ